MHRMACGECVSEQRGEPFPTPNRTQTYYCPRCGLAWSATQPKFEGPLLTLALIAMTLSLLIFAGHYLPEFWQQMAVFAGFGFALAKAERVRDWLEDRYDPADVRWS